MKNVTITLEENVAKWAKVWAAKHDSSLSRMLGNELKTKMKLDLDYDRAKESFLARVYFNSSFERVFCYRNQKN